MADNYESTRQWVRERHPELANDEKFIRDLAANTLKARERSQMTKEQKQAEIEERLGGRTVAEADADILEGISQNQALEASEMDDQEVPATPVPVTTETAPESNTEAPTVSVQERVNNPVSSEVEDNWGTVDQNAGIYDGWNVPAYVKNEGTLQPKHKGENNLWAAMVREAYTFDNLSKEVIAIDSTKGTMHTEENLKQEAAAYEEAESQAFRDHASKAAANPDLTTDQLTEELQIVAEIEAERAERSGDTFLTMAKAFGADTPELAAKVSGEMALYKVLRDAADDIDEGDIWAQVGSSFIPGDATHDRLAISGTTDPVGHFMRIRDGLEGLGPQDKEAALAQLSLQLKEKGVNDSQRVQLLQAIISPTPEEDLSEMFPDSDVAMDAVDLVLAVSGIGLALAGTYRGLKLLRALERMPDAQEAAAIARLMEDSERAAHAVGTTEEGLQNTLEPFLTEWVDPDSLDGASAGMLRNITKFDEKTRAAGADLARGTVTNKEGILTEEQMRIVTENYRNEISTWDGVKDISIRRNGRDLEATYTVEDEFGNVETLTDTYRVNLDDASEIEFKDPGTAKRHTTAKGVWATDDLKHFVEAAERLDSQDAVTLAHFRRLWKEALEPVMGKGFAATFKGFSPKQRARIRELDKVLLDGDAKGVVYTPDQLRSGVLGYKFDDQMIESYYHIRSVTDWLYYARNGEARTELSLGGFKSVTTADKVENFAKPFETAEDATQSVNMNKGKWYYDDTDPERNTFQLSDLDLEEAYQEGKVLVRLRDTRSFDGAEVEVKYALVDSKNVNQLPQEILPYRTGYIPKFNQDVGHVVKMVTPRNVDGTTYNALEDGAVEEAVRFFDNKKEADIFVEQEMAKLAAEGVSPTKLRYVRREDRQLEKERRIDAFSSEVPSFRGGMYSGARSSRELLTGIDGKPTPRINSIESISRALTSTSRFVSRNEWRLGMEETFVRTANQLVENPNQFKSFRDLASVQPDSENNRKIRGMYEAGADWLNFPTSEELLFNNAIQGVLDNSGILTKLPGAKKGLLSLKSTDPVGAARAAAFHGMLGWFNPVQLWVQAQGASVALSMNILDPISMGRVLKNQLGLQSMQYISQTENNMAHVAKALGMSLEDFKEYKQAWDRTGLADSVLMTADHAAASVGYGSTLSGLKRAADRGLMFYRPGELFNRRVSFTTAFDEWKRANKGAPLDDTGLKAITTRANNLMLNMSKANRASWQKGTLGLATQFQQINARTIESLLGANGNFSWGERGKIMAGQLALYGAAGVPIANLGQRMIMELAGITDVADLEERVSPEVVKAANEGILGYLSLQVLGVDAEIGERSALLGGTRRFVNDLLFTEGTLADKLFGAFGNTSSRFWGGLVGAYRPFSLSLAKNEPIEPMLLLGSPVLSSISTFRHADKALFMHHTNRIVDKNHATLIERDFSWREEVIAAIGLQLKDEATLWQRQKIADVQKSLEKNLINSIVSLTNQYSAKAMLTDGKLSAEDMRQFATEKAYLVQGAGDPLAVQRVIEGVQRKLEDTNNKESQSWRTFREYTDNQLISSFEKEFGKFMRVPGAYIGGELGGGFLHRQGVFDDNESEEE